MPKSQRQRTKGALRRILLITLNKFAQKFCRVPNSYTNELMGDRVPTEIPKNEIKSKNKSDSRNPTENAQDSDPSIKSQQTQRTHRTKE